MNSSPTPWFTVANAAEVASPALLVFPERIEENLRRVLALTGGPARLRPHVKTHKMAELIRLHAGRGVTRFKCATLAEAELTAAAGGTDVLLAYPLVGPAVSRFLELQRKHPAVAFSVVADDAGAIRELSKTAHAVAGVVEVLLDVDCGQHRTGVEPGPRAEELYRLLGTLPGLKPGGLHAYDGHIHDTDVAARESACRAAWTPVAAFRQRLLDAGLPVPRVVAGGSPTFPFHARRGDVECSPGTYVFWDAGYSTRLPDLDFLHAAALLTRVVSKPGGGRLCLDLGHKAVASEMPQPRVVFPEAPDARCVAHSEEHLVIETARAGSLAVGDALYGIPWHICPTVALHADAVVVREGRTVERWKVAARDRRLTV
jgi:D-serine deaminase-like pyridoxal phosphate-dependent protein